MITLTDEAAEQIKAIAGKQKAHGKAVRVFAEAGCCSGPKFGLAFDDKKADDHEVQHGGVQVIFDTESAKVLEGSVIDYVKTKQGEGFQIRSVAQTECSDGGCGCVCLAFLKAAVMAIFILLACDYEWKKL